MKVNKEKNNNTKIKINSSKPIGLASWAGTRNRSGSNSKVPSWWQIKSSTATNINDDINTVNLWLNTLLKDIARHANKPPKTKSSKI